MKKYILIATILLLTLLTGCDANYTLEFKEGKFDENMYLYTYQETFLDKTKTKQGVEEISGEMFQFQKNYNNFKMRFKYNKDYSGYEYTTKFNLKNYNNWPTIAEQCYENVHIDENGSVVTIQTSDEFLCYKKYNYLKSVNIQFKTNYEVVNNNANTVKNGIYTWNISKEESLNKPLFIQIQTKNIIKTSAESFNFIPLGIGIGVILLALLIFILISQRKKNNSF